MNIRKKMRSEKKLNPFNNHFDPKKVQQIVAETSANLEKEQYGIYLTLFASIPIHSFFVEIYDVLKKRILKSNTDTDLLSDRMIALTNRHYQLIMDTSDKRQKATESYFEDSFRAKIWSSDSSVGMIETSAAIETEIDALHTSLNFIAHFKDEDASNTLKTEISYVEDCKSIAKWSSVLFVVKHCYDDCVWNDGHMIFDKDVGEFNISFDEPKNLLLQKAGFYRLLRNIQGTYYMLRQWHQSTKKSDRGDFLFETKKKEVRIASAGHNNGYIYYTMEDGIDMEESDFEIYNKSGLESYYNYIDNISLPSIPDLTINDLVCMLSISQHLFRKAAKQCLNSAVMNRADFDKFPVKIKKSILTGYLAERTIYSLDQITSFIELLTNRKGKRINFWNYPFLSRGEDLIFPLLTIIDPILIYLIDRWLEDGGYQLDKRGPFFETYIKASISRTLESKNYKFFMPKSCKVYNSAGKYEEIDLLLNLRDVVVVAELKCEKYPMEVRDSHNGLSRLRGGSEQVIRKADFLVKYACELISQIGDISGKQIIKLVVTNNPLYTGYTLNGVAVVDYFLIESYISSGKITGNAVENKDGWISTTQTSEIILQASEDELNANFESNMYSPKSVEQALALVELKTTKVTPEGLNLQIFIQSAEYTP